MKTKFNGILTLLLALLVQISFAQEKTISGTVSDETGPLPGVNVIIKGTANGTQTDFDGKFNLKASAGDVLVFSYVGMTTIEKTVGSSSTMNVTMTGSNLLEEVVVVAYGSQTKKSIVGAVTVVDSDVIEKQQVTSVTSALQGSVPGVNIISSGGQPGDNATIRIRGIGSINASQDPLIVVDGAAFNGNLNTISPDQIESLNVLKDASSTALYGSRGSNGVILITTKKGKLSSPTKISIKSSVGIADQAVDYHDLVSADEYATYTWEALKNASQYVDGNTSADAATYATNNLIAEFGGYNPWGIANPVDTNGNLVSSTKKWETDWADYLFNDAAVRQEHALSISGGSESTSYYVGANYLNQEGSIETSEFERISTRVNLDTKVNDWLNVGFNTSYSTSTQNYPEQSGSAYQSATAWIFAVPSIYPLNRRDANGDLVLDNFGNTIYDYGNTLLQATNGSRPALSGENAVGALYKYKVQYKRDNFTANGYAKVDITDDLYFKTNLSYEKYLYDSYEYAHNEFGYAANVGGRVSQDRDITSTINWINQLNYTKSFDDHNFSIDAIHESYKLKIDALGAQGTGYLPNVTVLNGSTTPESVSGYLSEERLESVLGRIAYNYQDKYYLEGTFRTDGSSRFDESVRWGNFFSVGGSWVVSDEEFLANSDVISFLKLKASYGELGNNRGIGYFPYKQLFDTGWNQLDNTGVLLGGVADPFLKWEKTASSNFGADIRFLQDRFSLGVDYYSKKSVDLIYDKPLSPSTGNSSITTNVGSVKNYGWEFSISSRNIQKQNVEWTTNLNFSFDKNEISELTQDGFINGTKRWEVGKSLYEFYIREYAGVNPDNGKAMWYQDVLDANGDPTGEQVTTEVYADASRNYTGKSSLPDVIGGLTNYVRVGDFDLNLLFNFSMGSYVYDSTYAGLMSGFESVGSASPDVADRWQNPGDITDIPRLEAASNDYNSTSDRFLFKNDYLRLKALNFGYNVPTDVINTIGLSKLRVFFQGDNLLTFASHEGIDPEQSVSGTTDNRSFNQRIVSFGLNLEF
ncbi:TonB-dependent receptor [Lutibacter sp. A80]|uniref:SusC/RagA family TonB-linked outer membrane protein n=1 Tax=Lutibacter sp. A80 TaxID=2918453 RepID=UPI001F05E565|nr:TonB-dependent receptor [Lutibacter sp. A80]UMB61929.1 TonB-dependent receptor [Lutibacter sp. A80]